MIRKGAPSSRPRSSGGCNCVRIVTVGLFIICAGWLAMGISMFRAAAEANQQATISEKLRVAENAMARRLRVAEDALSAAIKNPVRSGVWHGPGYDKPAPHGDDRTLHDHAAMGHDFGAAAAAAGASTPPPEKEGGGDGGSSGDGEVSSQSNAAAVVVQKSVSLSTGGSGGTGMASRVAAEAGGIGWDQSEWESVWVKDQTLLPPFWKPPEGTDLDNVGTYVDGEPTIYLMVASYRGSNNTLFVLKIFFIEIGTHVI
jgi:hypothetical protein